MKHFARRSIRWLFCLWFIMASFSVSYAQDPLQNGVPLNTSIPAVTFKNYYIEVPSDAVLLTVSITGGGGELDLFMKYGKPITGGSYQELVENSDFRSDVYGVADEKIEITPQSNPPLKDGKWYIAPANFNDVETRLVITATYKPASSGGGADGKNSGGGGIYLQFATRDHYWVPWGQVRLSCQMKGFKPDTSGDFFLALSLQSGQLLFLNDQYQLSTDPIPFQRSIPFSDREILVLEGELGESLGEAVLTIYGAIVKAGQSPFDLKNWQSNLAYTTLVFGPLSGIQRQVLADLGNPQALIIEFNHNACTRSETWLYQAGNETLGKTYQFVNGSLLLDPPELSAAGGSRASSKQSTPLFLGPGTFHPTITLAELRAFLGSPDHILTNGQPGMQLHIFDGAGVSVTLEDGKIRQIEAY